MSRWLLFPSTPTTAGRQLHRGLDTPGLPSSNGRDGSPVLGCSPSQLPVERGLHFLCEDLRSRERKGAQRASDRAGTEHRPSETFYLFLEKVGAVTAL